MDVAESQGDVARDGTTFSSSSYSTAVPVDKIYHDRLFAKGVDHYNKHSVGLNGEEMEFTVANKAETPIMSLVAEDESVKSTRRNDGGMGLMLAAVGVVGAVALIAVTRKMEQSRTPVATETVNLESTVHAAL